MYQGAPSHVKWASTGAAVSQMALAIPLIAFYEISILIGMWIEKKRAEEDKKAEEAENAANSGPGS